MSITEAVNFVAIDDRTATCGQPTPAQFAAARDEGYEAVVNLLPSVQDNALKDEDQLVGALDMAYHYIPVIWTDPRPENFTAFCDVMRSLAGKKVLIHCAMNMRVTA